MLTEPNIEGLAKWNIRPPRRRKAGLAALVLLRNETQFVIAALESIVEAVDEIVICLQGEQDDATDELVSAWKAGRSNVTVHAYPHLSLPNGPGHGSQPIGSVYERSYFYNWALSKVRRTHVLKWDGDMVALDGFAQALRDQKVGEVCNFLRIQGYEIVATNPLRTSATQPMTPLSTRVFPADAAIYATGEMCEQLNCAGRGWPMPPAYLHMKWVKPLASQTQAWPEGWESMEHFQNIMARAKPGAVYDGPVPEALLHRWAVDA